MRIFILLLPFYIAGCALVNVQEGPPPVKRRLPYFQTSVLGCKPLNKIFYKQQLVNIDPFFRTSSMCAETYSDVRVRKDLIRSYSPIYYVTVGKEDLNNDDPKAPLKITEFNVEACEVSTDKASQVVYMTCNELDGILNQ